MVNYAVRLWSMFTAVTLILLGLMLAQVASANSIDDPYITSVSAVPESTALGATTTYTVTVITNTTIPADNTLWLYFNSQAGCEASEYSDCTFDLSNATVTHTQFTQGDSGSDTTLSLNNANQLAADTYTFSVRGVKNADTAVVGRVFASTSASEESVLLTNYDANAWYVTDSNPMLFGTPVIIGTITDPDGNILPNTSVSLHNQDWSVYSSVSTDDYGYFAMFADYKTWAQGSYTLSVYPGPDLGYLTTETEVTYAGAAIDGNLAVDASTYFFSGTVEYGENDSATVTSQPGDPITNATVNFYPMNGGNGYSDSTDETGAYQVAVRPGTYLVSIYANIDHSNSDQAAALDWVYYGSGEEFTISKEGTETVDFTATRTSALLTGQVAGPDGEVVQGSISLSNQEKNYSSYTAPDGSFTMNLVPGTYSVYFYPDTNVTANAEQYYLETQTVTITEGNNKLALTLGQKTSIVQFTVVDQNGTPLADIQLQAWRENEWVGGTTDAAGTGQLYLQADQRYEVGVWSEDYINTTEPQTVQVAENETVNVSFELQVPDATINVLVKNGSGDVPTELYGYTWCYDENYQHNYGASINNALGTVSVLVDEDSGEFSGTCDLWVSDETLGAANGETVSVVRGESASVEFTLVERSAELTVHVKKNNGKYVKDSAAGHVFLSSMDTSTWYDEVLSADGKVTFNVVPGTYSAGIWFDDQSYIPLWSKNNGTATVTEEGSGKLVLTVLGTDGEVTGTVKDPAGEAVAFGWAYCGNWDEVNVGGDFEEGTIIDAGGQVMDGTFTIPLVSGHTYSCNVGLPPEYTSQGWLAPEHQEVSFLSANKELDKLKFQFSEADSSIVGTVELKDDTAGITAANDLDHVWCWAWSEEGSYSYSEATEGDDGDMSVNLAAQSGQHWYAGCDGSIDENWYWTEEIFDKQLKEAGEYSYKFKLVKSDSWIVYPSVSETFSATENKTITMEDGTILNIPAYALASEGDVTVSATPTTDIVHTGDELLNVPWNFEAFQNDELIETFVSNVTIEIHYTDEQVAELGIDEDNLLPKFWDEATGTWQTPDNIAQDKEANIITITTNHFTQYGVTYDGQLASNHKPNQPRRPKVTATTDSTASLQWKKPSDSTVDKFQVQLRKHKVTKKKTWDSYKSVKKYRLTAKKLKDNTRYQFRVRACNGAGCSGYTDWKSFKTE